MQSGNYSEKLIIAANQNVKERDYWLKRLSGDLEKTAFFYDYQIAGAERQQEEFSTVPMEKVTLEFSGEIFRQLLKLSNKSDARLHMILAAALVTLLYKYTGNTDIIVGTSIYKQEVDTEFINTALALRNKVEEDMTFKDLLLRIRNTVVEAVENQNYPMEILLEKLDLTVVPGEFPLFDAAILLKNIQDKSYLRTAHCNMLWISGRKETSLEMVLEYNPLLFKESTIRRIGIHFSLLLETVLWDVNRQLSGIEILTERERKQLLEDFNSNGMEVPLDKSFHWLFAEQVEQAPDRAAVVCGHQQVTYRQLNERAGQLAQELKNNGVGPDHVVAIMADRSIDMIEGVIGIIKSGGAYLPIDPTYPRERIAFMLQDSQTQWLVTQNHLKDKIPDNYKGTIINLSKVFRGVQGGGFSKKPPWPPEAKSTNLVYVIYTSGSTGKPKGVMVQHDHFVNVGLGWRKEYRLREIEVNLLQMASFSFDVFAGDIARVFLNGGKMVVNAAGVLDPETIYQLIARYRVTLFESTPSYVIPFMDHVYDNHLPVDSLKLLILGSDICPVRDFRRLVQRFGGQMRIVNSYGVTEAAIDSSYYEEPRLDNLPGGGNVPIGRPFPNMKFYIFSSPDGGGNPGNLQPVGVPGELYIGGDSIARGYLYREELTAERFLADPFIVGRRIYKTGDMARWLPDGNVEFLGRSDYQVKIRGFRIELGEIESRLLEHPDIKEAAVVQKEDKSGKYLCGYIVSDRPPNSPELRNYLGQKLPDYMVPWFFVRMDRLPLTPNGKIHRKALPEPESNEETPYVPPRDEREKTLVDIWSKVLAVEKGAIGIDTNFFDLGGNSLKAIITTSKIHKAFDVKMQLTDIFELQTIRGIAQHIKRKAAIDTFAAIRPPEKKDYYSLSSAQKRLYFLQQMDLQGTVYNIPGMVELDGDLEKEQLEEAFKELVYRHESLRTSFQMVKGEVVQRVHEIDEIQCTVEFYDLAAGAFVRAFDLSKAPLVRIGLVRREAGNHLFMADMHHIISDGVSQGILVKDFIALYQGKLLAPLRIQYKDYTEWLAVKNDEEIENLAKQEAYWLKEFEGEIPVLELPTDYPRPEVKSFAGGVISFSIGEEVRNKLNKIVSGTGTTLYMVLLAAWNILLSRYGNREDIVVGSVIAGRRHADLEKVIGMFVNTLALRNFPVGEKIFSEFLQEVKNRALGAYENQDYPFENLVEKLPVHRDTGRDPLFDVLFALDNTAGKPVNRMIGGSENESGSISDHLELEAGNRAAKFDLSLYSMESEEGLVFAFEYCTGLFRQDTIERMCKNYARLLEVIGDNIDIKIKDMDILSPRERQRLLVELNDTAVDYPIDKTIHRLFEEQAAKTPDSIAVVGKGNHEGHEVSYMELNKRTNQLAEILREKGIQADIIVGIMIGRCLEMIIGIFAILKAGGAYLPIDPGYPKERIDYMLADSGAKMLVTANTIGKNYMSNLSYMSSVSTATPVAKKTQLAYIIYTSGSTGKPKGVAVDHGSVVNILFALFEEYPLLERDTYLFKTSYLFDVSVAELFGWYFKGGRVAVLESGAEKDPKQIVDTIEKYCVTHINFVPSMFNAFLDILQAKPDTVKQLSALRYIFLAGEALSPLTVSQFRDVDPDGRILLENIYGPTEGTIYSSKYPLCQWNGAEGIPIGKPMQNIRLFILDRTGHLQPVGVPGELCIGGAGVARGYLNRPELTAEKFVPISYISKKIYKTGDLARWLPDKNIEFLGRMDNQVKVRGFRVELGEIEFQLTKHPGVKEAVVLAKGNGSDQKYLCAYTVPQGVETTELREYLAKLLPHYMVPGHFVTLDRVPLTPGGKIDRQMLLGYNESRPVSRATYVAPGTGMEKLIAETWKEVLQLEEVGVHDNFFDLGGNSFDVIKINSQLQAALKKELPVVKMFKYPTVSTLAYYLTHGDPGEISAEKEKKMTEKMDKGKSRLKERTRRGKRSLK